MGVYVPTRDEFLKAIRASHNRNPQLLQIPQRQLVEIRPGGGSGQHSLT